ncbi:helix-turn-helix domain-containing protein [Microvirga sp. W0021]|uniref:Helix-turn-helix domain-containing protein n=1 Tax=Hohaiivirga grylli TaxID=3133970 RepID=A0ABV0BIH0_9HYPH
MMFFSIGDLAHKTGVKVPTIRFYENIGLLAEPMRTEGGQRRYSADDVARLSFIRHARQLGFEVEDVRELLVLSADPDRPCAEVDGIVYRHLDDVKQKIEKLSALQKELERMVCGSRHGSIGECRVIQVLADHDMCESDVH